jgi:CheY-like chemotaxis protein
MNGEEVMRRLSQFGVSKPIYVLTADVVVSDIEQYKAICFTETPSKPLDYTINIYITGSTET